MSVAATSDNLILLLVFVGLYLADCVVLLQPAQALARVTLRRRDRKAKGRNGKSLGFQGRCSAVLDFGLTVYPVRGRYLAILNPLTPFTAVCKTQPIECPATNPRAAKPLDLRRIIAVRIRTARMSAALIAHGLLLFIVLPALLLAGETGRLLVALGAAFLSALLILVVCYADRRAARLPMAGFWAVAAPALLCLPVSLNAPRKLALLIPAAAQASELLPLVPAERRQAPLGELRLVLDRAASESSESLMQAAEAHRRRLASDYPES